MASIGCQRCVRERVQHYPRNLAGANKQINKQFVSLGYCISLGCKGQAMAPDRSGGEARACSIGQAAGGKSRLGSQKMAFPGASDGKVNGFMRRQ